MDGMMMMMMMMIFFHIFGLIPFPAVIASSQISSRTLRNQDPTKHKNWHLLNNDGYCGVSHNQRIIGGVDAGLGKYPWIVRLGFIYEEGDVLLKCAGSIVNEKYVLTANHCFQPNDELGFVRAGEYDERTNPDCEDDVCAPEYIDFNVEKIINHKEYRDGVSFVNDITLIRIEGEFEFDGWYILICMNIVPKSIEDMKIPLVKLAGMEISPHILTTKRARPMMKMRRHMSSIA
ncbi:hypothetical protein LSTR_LSTR002022 [Laodelphax striatellus]|uniref:Peptidase S1 domain-containing protein n=1 Tax=Laodelphax striatellus TaxID=195883 RepID=A0A482XIC6_LAOST|nr:hypothetical protein LSTR_LSTR002022 [Laodelphax striatellus]